MAFVVPTVLLSVIFFDESLDVYQAIAIVVIVLGIVITTLTLRAWRKAAQRSIAVCSLHCSP